VSQNPNNPPAHNGSFEDARALAEWDFLRKTLELSYAAGAEPAGCKYSLAWKRLASTRGGTCSGGWCKQVMIEGDDKGGSFACECAYFV
jgi:hypothetical protein